MSDVWLNIIMVVVFVLIGGAFSGAEIALVSLRESQVRAMADNGGRRGKAVQRLLSDPNRFLAAVQVGVTVAGFFSAAFGASTLAAPVADWLVGMGVQAGLAGTLALVLVTIAISYVSLVVGELTPKRLALQRAEGFALLVASPLTRGSPPNRRTRTSVDLDSSQMTGRERVAIRFNGDATIRAKPSARCSARRLGVSSPTTSDT